MLRILAFSALFLLLTGCLEEECEETVTFQTFHPVYVTAESWRDNSFVNDAPENVCEPSGFYVYDELLFIVDKGSGLHILDNTDNANPRAEAFIRIPGGHGIAVRNDILYINQFTDLLAFDLRNPHKPEFLSRTEDVFVPHTVFANVTQDGRFVSGYERGAETVEVGCNNRWSNENFFIDQGVLFANAAVVNDLSTITRNVTTGGQAENVGTGGSLARFTITKGTLYAVDDHQLRTFSLRDPAKPEFVSVTDLGWGIETIFPQGDLLFIGSTTGMHIYGVEDAYEPRHLSTFQHVQRCDPVVVQDDIAYVTMWGGSNCGSVGDQLMVIDVSDPTQPRLLQEEAMSNSHGLGIADGMLFLASATEGIKVFDLQDDGRLGRLKHTESGFIASDVIALPHQDRLIVFGMDQSGIRQYDYAANGRLKEKSSIDICN